MLNVAEVNLIVKEIAKLTAEGDDEAAHSREDRLYRKVLRAIEELGGPGAELATAALETSNLFFNRWCA